MTWLNFTQRIIYFKRLSKTYSMFNYKCSFRNDLRPFALFLSDREKSLFQKVFPPILLNYHILVLMDERCETSSAVCRIGLSLNRPFVQCPVQIIPSFFTLSCKEQNYHFWCNVFVQNSPESMCVDVTLFSRNFSCKCVTEQWLMKSDQMCTRKQVIHNNIKHHRPHRW